MTSLSENTVVTTSGGLVELGYSQITTSVTLGTSSGVVISPISVVCDGSPILVEFFAVMTTVGSGAGSYGITQLMVDGTVTGRMTQSYTASAIGEIHFGSSYGSQRLTPSAGVHTFGINGYRSSAASSQINAGNGSGDGYPPAFIRISKIIQASQFIVPLASAPLVTSLPSAPIDGQEIRYLADATNGVVWNLRYRAASASSYKWEFIGGPPLYIAGGGYQTITSTSYVDLTGVALSIPLSGDYDVRLDAQMQQPGGNGWVTYLAVSNNGSTTGDYSFPISYAPATYSVDRGDSRVNRMTLTASTLQGRARVNAGTGYVGYCKLTASPIRVG